MALSGVCASRKPLSDRVGVVWDLQLSTTSLPPEEGRFNIILMLHRGRRLNWTTEIRNNDIYSGATPFIKRGGGGARYPEYTNHKTYLV